MELRLALRSEREEVLDLLSHWYNERDFFARYNQNDHRFRDELCLVARDQGRMVSTVQIFDRTINIAGQSVPMGGIGSVFTLEEYRHKGVASDLMRLAVDVMIAHGFEVSLLFAERFSFYRQFGWREIERQFSVLTDAANLRMRDETIARYTIDSFVETRDLETVAAIHREYSGRFDVTDVRDLAAWRSNLKYAGSQPLHPGEGSEEYFVLCREQDRIAAYARLTHFHGFTMIMEYGYRPPDAAAMLAIFKYLGQIAAGAMVSARVVGEHRRAKMLTDARPPSPILVTHTAHDSDLEAHLAEAGTPVMHHADNFYMWRVLAPEKLARRFAIVPEATTARAFEIFADSRSLYWTADRF
jgi:predicted N-acetyltransferase YhbS